MSNRTVNLKDVAAKAGVSITTVSHVINKTRFVKPETTAAVESAIKELNYVHNLAAKTLRSKKSGIIGVMITGFGNPYFLEILQGIEHIYFKRKRVSNDSWEHWKLYGGAGKTIGHL